MKPVRSSRSSSRKLPHSVAAREVIRIGSFSLPVPVFAVGVSVILHGTILAVSQFMTWTPGDVSSPKIELSRGEHAIQVMIITTSYPDPEEEETPTGELESHEEVVSELPTTVINPPSEHAEIVEISNPDCEPINDKDLEESFSEDTPTENATQVQDTAVVEGKIDNPSEVALEKKIGDVPRELTLPVVDSTLRDKPDVRQTLAPSPTKNFAQDVHSQKQLDVSSIDVKNTHVPVTQDIASDSLPGVETGIEIIDLPHPNYPRISRRRGEEGFVLLQVEVLTSGVAGEIKVLREPGFPRLTQAAIEAVRQARFSPARKDGRPVKDVVRIPFRFVLR